MRIWERVSSRVQLAARWWMAVRAVPRPAFQHHLDVVGSLDSLRIGGEIRCLSNAPTLSVKPCQRSRFNVGFGEGDPPEAGPPNPHSHDRGAESAARRFQETATDSPAAVPGAAPAAGVAALTPARAPRGTTARDRSVESKKGDDPRAGTVLLRLGHDVGIQEEAAHSSPQSASSQLANGVSRWDSAWRSGISRFVPRGMFSTSHWPKGFSGGDPLGRVTPTSSARPSVQGWDLQIPARYQAKGPLPG